MAQDECFLAKPDQGRWGVHVGQVVRSWGFQYLRERCEGRENRRVRKPLCIDLFCGLGGWTDGFLAEGWDVIGFDIERHQYAITESHFGGLPKTRVIRYPAQLVLQDVLTLHGRQFRNVDCIVASPPCQEFSYMAMPWSRAKQIAGALREEMPFPEGYDGSRTIAELTALFDACFRIQREACEVAGRYIPMVVENVRGAQLWVGKARANFGSFYFWGDVAMVGGQVVAGSVPRFGQTVKAARRTVKQEGRNFHFMEKYGIPSPSFHGTEDEPSVAAALALKTTSHANIRDGHSHTRHLTNQRESDLVKFAGTKCPGHDTFRESGQPCGKLTDPRYPSQKQPVWFNDDKLRSAKCGGDWFGSGDDCSLMRSMSSKSSARKAASAQIAKIPFPLSSYIARSFRP